MTDRFNALSALVSSSHPLAEQALEGTGLPDEPLGRLWPLPDAETRQLAELAAGPQRDLPPVTVVDLERLAVLDTLHVDRRGEPGAHGLAYVPGCGCLGS